MKYNPVIHNRRSIRLKGYDYSKAGLYFITFCVQNKECLFGNIKNNKMILNDAGKMIQTQWEKLPQRFTEIDLHEFVVMPNHFHGIVEIVSAVGAPFMGAQNTGAQQVENNENLPTVGAPFMGAQNTGASGNKNNEIVPAVGAPFMGAQITGASGEENNDAEDTRDRAPTRGAPTDGSTINTLGEMMGAFKSLTTLEYINGVNDLDWDPFDGKLWQRNFYEHIIRNEAAYFSISDYIINNPSRWTGDKFYKK